VLDKWLKDNDGKLEDEVRVQRIKHWREEAIEQLRRKLNLSRR
jgi:DNA-binding transcriptional regulator YiaG